jgi:hypothetical protein
MKTTENLRDVFKNLKHQKPTHKYCPRCASPKLDLSSSLDYWLLPQQYACKECGYVGTVFMELEKTEEEKETS